MKDFSGLPAPDHVYFTLNDQGEPVAAVDMVAWAGWIIHHPAERFVGLAQLDDGTVVSTAFTGINPQGSSILPPQLWETRVLGGPMDGTVTRYASAKDARYGHDATVQVARLATNLPPDPENSITPSEGDPRWH